jgi:hypothetical protein
MGSEAVYSVDAYHAGNVRFYYDCPSALSDTLFSLLVFWLDWIHRGFSYN